MILPFVLWACFDEGNCIVNFTDVVNVAFKNFNNAAVTVAFDSIQSDGITLKNYTAKQQSALQLPVNPHRDTTLFIFFYGGNIDSLEMAYKRQAVILTSDCGANNYVTQLRIAFTDLDSARVINDKLLKDVPTHVEVFF